MPEKKRRIKRSVKFSIVILFVLIILGTLGFSGWLKPNMIHGYFTLDKELAVQDENVVIFFINSTNEASRIGNTTRYMFYQKYQIGKDKMCIRDCLAVCDASGLSYYKAYSQQWGVCRCKCEK